MLLLGGVAQIVVVEKPSLWVVRVNIDVVNPAGVEAAGPLISPWTSYPLLSRSSAR